MISYNTHRWCLYIRHLSGSSYEVLKNSGILKLPSQRTLRDYTYHTHAASGFALDVDKQLMEAANLQSCPEREKFVIIIMDEMHIREDLVYDKHTGIYNNQVKGIILLCGSFRYIEKEHYSYSD